MQDTDDEDFGRNDSVEHDVFTTFHAAEPRTNVITGSTQLRIRRQHPAAGLHFGKVLLGLRFSPALKRVLCNAFKVSLGQT